MNSGIRSDSRDPAPSLNACPVYVADWCGAAASYGAWVCWLWRRGLPLWYPPSMTCQHGAPAKSLFWVSPGCSWTQISEAGRRKECSAYACRNTPSTCSGGRMAVALPCRHPVPPARVVREDQRGDPHAVVGATWTSPQRRGGDHGTAAATPQGATPRGFHVPRNLPATGCPGDRTAGRLVNEARDQVAGHSSSK